MSLQRREVLARLGAATASTLLWAFGCSAPATRVRRAPQVSGEVRTWLHDAVARLAGIYPTVHALAVSRHRTTAALDVLGANLARRRSDGAILRVRTRDGAWREHVTSELTEAGVDAAATALGAPRARKPIDFGRAPAVPDEPPALDERDLRRRVERLLHGDAALARKIVYAAALIDLDDTTRWFVAPGRDLAQRSVRVRQLASRAAWSGSRPVVRHCERAWSGGLDDHTLTPDELTATSEAVLEQLTPGGFDDGERSLVLDPSVVAVLVDTAIRGLCTTTAAERPEVARRAALDRPLAAPLLGVVDDPSVPASYGGFQFDDDGEPAAPVTVIDAGRLATRLGAAPGRARRAGHLGLAQPGPSHLVVAPGTATARELQTDGLLLEVGLDATLDPAADRIRLACGRARELKAGNTTGRVHADVELVGSLTGLLTAIDGVARDPVQRSLASPELPRSIAAPALRTRGFVRARRSRA